MSSPFKAVNEYNEMHHSGGYSLGNTGKFSGKIGNWNLGRKIWILVCGLEAFLTGMWAGNSCYRASNPVLSA